MNTTYELPHVRRALAAARVRERKAGIAETERQRRVTDAVVAAELEYAASAEAAAEIRGATKVVAAVATGSGAPPAWVWECPQCKTQYSKVQTCAHWKKRGHCAKCEVESWRPETHAETKAAFSQAWPAIARALTSDQHPNVRNQPRDE